MRTSPKGVEQAVINREIETSGFNDYISDCAKALDKDSFNRELADFVRRQSDGLILSPMAMDTLFEICDDHVRTVTAINGFREDRVRSDQSKALSLCQSVVQKLDMLKKRLERDANLPMYPQQCQAAKFAYRQIAAVRETLEKAGERIELQARMSGDMIRMASLKASTNEFVSTLDDYTLAIFPKRAQTDRNIVVAGAMVAAGKFSQSEVRNDVLDRIPMARRRAREFVKSTYVKKHISMVIRKVRTSEIDDSDTKSRSKKRAARRSVL